MRAAGKRDGIFCLRFGAERIEERLDVTDALRRIREVQPEVSLYADPSPVAVPWHIAMSLM